MDYLEFLPENITKSVLNENEKLVLAVLLYSFNCCEKAKESTKLIMAMDRLRQLTGMKRPNLYEAVRNLERYGLIKRKAGERRTANKPAVASEFTFDFDKIFKGKIEKISSEDLFKRFFKESSETLMGPASTSISASISASISSSVSESVSLIESKKSIESLSENEKLIESENSNESKKLIESKSLIEKENNKLIEDKDNNSKEKVNSIEEKEDEIDFGIINVIEDKNEIDLNDRNLPEDVFIREFNRRTREMWKNLEITNPSNYSYSVY